jgi:hypothetical protein
MEANIPAIDTAPRSPIRRYPATRPHKSVHKTGTWKQQCRCRWNLGRGRPSSRNFKRRLPSRNHPRCRSVIHGSGTALKNGVGTDNLGLSRHTGVGQSRSLQAYWSRARGGEDRDKGMGYWIRVVVTIFRRGHAKSCTSPGSTWDFHSAQQV